MIRSNEESQPPIRSLSIQELRTVLNGALIRRSFLFSRVHGNERSSERHISFEDLVQVCSRGKYKQGPEYNPDKQNWVYKVVGTDLDGQKTIAVIAVDNNNCWVTVITCY